MEELDVHRIENCSDFHPEVENTACHLLQLFSQMMLLAEKIKALVVRSNLKWDVTSTLLSSSVSITYAVYY